MDIITIVLWIILFISVSILYIRTDGQLKKEKEKNIILETKIKSYQIYGNKEQSENIEFLEKRYKELMLISQDKDKQIEQLQDFIKLISCGHFKPDYEKRIIKFDKKDLAVKLAGELISQDDVLTNTKTITFIPYSEKL